ncbi:MAG: coenzyme PQQ precursor peptide PqqA [Acidovorax sp. 17-64-282]|nr:MAG: coenzyme PQQ precursor peptide PqqA [Acidovorax sp. 35-64-16]OYY85139.1 MAG: coenzyme PQQ precursor peptide PqqA [Acidovorax sp. 28-64-14]OZA57510.1 MAG: coenzyme PQQ precursor peptide PqqA [Acidovorax sp. 17-64-282]OZA67278.1 MAG: coenzyme PQQ precursor peptide PqqA [Acidovorax sp. 39-64-12]
MIQEWHGVTPPSRRHKMNWQTPAYCEIRLGFEVTAYVYVR